MSLVAYIHTYILLELLVATLLIASLIYIYKRRVDDQCMLSWTKNTRMRTLPNHYYPWYVLVRTTGTQESPPPLPLSFPSHNLDLDLDLDRKSQKNANAI